MATASRIILITGANSGVGYAATKVLASASPNYHIIMACRSPSKGQEAMKEIQSSGIKGSISLLPMDVADEKSIIDGAKKVEEEFSRLDVLISNAGIAFKDELLTQESMQNIFKVNVTGPMLVMKYFEPLLEKSKSPYALQVSSGLGSIHNASQTPYSSSSEQWTAYRTTKSALNMVMLQAHRRLSQKGFKNFGVCPGFVRSYLRGTSEEEIGGSGHAGDPMESGQLMLDIIEGKRDGDVGKVVHKGGVYPW